MSLNWLRDQIGENSPRSKPTEWIYLPVTSRSAVISVEQG